MYVLRPLMSPLALLGLAGGVVAALASVAVAVAFDLDYVAAWVGSGIGWFVGAGVSTFALVTEQEAPDV